MTIEPIEGVDDTITISLDDILHAIRVVFEVAKSRNLSKLTIGHNQFWCLDPDEAFEFREPPEHLVGDLYDGAEIIRDIEQLRPGLIGLNLTEIASVLNFIGSNYPSLSSTSSD